MAGELNYDPSEFYRLAEDVPSEEEMDLATEMMLDALADEAAEGIEENQ